MKEAVLIQDIAHDIGENADRDAERLCKHCPATGCRGICYVQAPPIVCYSPLLAVLPSSPIPSRKPQSALLLQHKLMPHSNKVITSATPYCSQNPPRTGFCQQIRPENRYQPKCSTARRYVPAKMLYRQCHEIVAKGAISQNHEN